MHFLTDASPDAEIPRVLNETMFIEDGNALVHSLKALPSTFRETIFKILEQLKFKPNVIFSTDSYLETSVKSQERTRRGTSDKLIVNKNTLMPASFPNFLKNGENKTQLFQLMLDILSNEESVDSILQLEEKKFIMIVQGKAVQLTSDGLTVSNEEMNSLYSTQEETDTRVVLYILYALQKGYKCAVIRSPDTDILLILLYYAPKFHPLVVLFDTGKGANRRVINVTDLAEELGPAYCEALLGLHCFTGEDCNCAFKGQGKLKPLKKMLKMPRYQETFRALGNSWSVSDKVLSDLEQFTCFMYGQPKVTSVNKVRSIMVKTATGGTSSSLKQMKKVDLSKMPPCRSSLIPHIKRANFRNRLFKLSHEPTPEIPVLNEAHG